MKYLSVCSGIEAATVAWSPLGWKAEAFSEIEKFPSSVLAHHYPNIPNYGDMIKFKEWKNANIDVLVGGTPCQSFSVAGLRKGLDDPRGNLMLTYLAIAAKYRPKWLVWENVPGVLSSNRGRDFGTFLGGLAEIGYGFSYRVLDAQYFGLAQRRKRVFVVGCIGDWRASAAVLFERHSLSGDSTPSQEEKKIPPPNSNRGFDREGISVVNDRVVGTLDTQCGFQNQTHQSLSSGHYVVNDNSHVVPTSNILLKNDKDSIDSPIRRLTPLECERLQGFPDDYTKIPYRNKAVSRCPLGSRYKAVGNSMAVPVVRWIGERIIIVDKLVNDVAHPPISINQEELT